MCWAYIIFTFKPRAIPVQVYMESPKKERRILTVLTWTWPWERPWWWFQGCWRLVCWLDVTLLQHMSPVINNTLKVLQTVVLSLDEQYVTNLRFTALENTLRAILNVCFKIVWKRDIPKALELLIIHISFMWLFWGSLVWGSCYLYLQNSK